MKLSNLSFPNALVGNPGDPINRPPTKTFGGDNFGIGFNFFVFFYFIFCCTSCQSQPVRDLVCFQKECVQVEIAQKPEELTRGLQFREKLARDAGMLFIFPNSQAYSFWMKDTKIPLDMIWMDSSQRVVYVKKNVPPCIEDPCAVYTPEEEAMYVLEINSTAADAFQIHLGDTAAFRFNRGKF